MLLEVKGSNKSVYFLAPVFQKERGRGWVGGRSGAGVVREKRKGDGGRERERKEMTFSLSFKEKQCLKDF